MECLHCLLKGAYCAAAFLLPGAPGPLWALPQGAGGQRGVLQGPQGSPRSRTVAILCGSRSFILLIKVEFVPS